MNFFAADAQIDQLGQEILATTWTKFPTLGQNQVAMTWIVYDSPVIVNTGGALTPDVFWQHPVRGFSYRGVERIYPASVIKIFYLVAAYEWLEKGMIQDTPELERALRDMIVESSNDATSLVVDILSGTTSGPELPSAPFETWKYQRNIINRYYQSLGWLELEGINVCQKTWGDGPYGRDRMFYGQMFENRNMLTTNATARLLHSIIGGVAVSSARSQLMMKLLQRSTNPETLTTNGEENQVTGFLGEGLPTDANLWSKAGWTSQVRHDAAYIEVPSIQPYLLVVFTEGKESAKNRDILPFISQQVMEVMKTI